MLWRSSCSPSGAIWKSLGPSFGRSRRVLCHSDTHYVLHTTCDYRTYLGVVSCPQKRKEFVHLVFEEAEDYNLFLKTCPGGQVNPGSSAQLCHTACSLSWEYAKFKVVKELELHRVLMVRRTNSCFTAGPAALAMLHALSALDSLDLDTWGELAARTLMGSAERTTPRQKSVMSTATLASPTSCYGRTSSSRSSASPCVFDL